MKICFFSISSSTNQDGASLSMLNIACELAERGNKIVLVLSSGANLESIRSKKNIKCFIIPAFNMRVNLNYITRTTGVKFTLKYICNTFYMLKIYRILKGENINIIHINGLNHQMGAQIAQKLQIPYVWHIRQLMEEDLGQTIFAKNKVWEYVKRANAIIAISNTVKDKFEKEFKRRIITVYNGVPIDKYWIEKNEILYNQITTFILPGRIAPGKGQLDAVKAIKKLNEKKKFQVELFIIGNTEDREYEKKLRHYICENNLDKIVHIEPYVSDLRKFRKKCDIGLTCSKNEAFGRVTIENQLAGLLVIGADTGGTAEIIKNNETGLLYKEGSFMDLADKIEYALMHKSEMRTIAQFGKEKAVEEFSIQRVVDQVYKIYEEIGEVRWHM